MKYETYLPIFSGFYGTLWEIDYNYIEECIKEDRQEKCLFSEIDFNDLKIDNSGYEKFIVKAFCDKLSKKMPEFVNSVELQKIINPREYNFANDSANIEIDINILNVRTFIYSHKGSFELYLKSKYTSCDGFMSHYENDFQTWENETKNFTDFSKNGHYLGSILDFIARVEDIKEDDFFENIQGNFSIMEFVENYDDLISQSDNSLFEFLTKNGISKDYADYIETSYSNKVLESLYLPEKILSIVKEYETYLASA